MSFAVAGRSIADLEDVTLEGGRPGLGFYQLNFIVRLRFWPTSDRIGQGTLDVVGGEVLVRQGRNGSATLLGRLHRTAGVLRATAAEPARPVFTWDLSLELPPERLEALERRRAGGDLYLQIRLKAQTAAGGDAELRDEVKEVEVNQSTWARVLSELGYRDTLLLEVAVASPDTDKHLAAAAARLKEARDEYLNGRYHRVVESCRHVLEALGNALNDGHGNASQLRAAFDHPESLTKDQRIMAVRRSLFVLACLASHSKDNVSLRTSWERHDALGLLTTTAGIVHWLAESRRSTS